MLIGKFIPIHAYVKKKKADKSKESTNVAQGPRKKNKANPNLIW